MKRLILSGLFIGLCFNSNAQKNGNSQGPFAKGDLIGYGKISTWGEGGKITFNGQESDKSKNNSTNVSLAADYVLNDRAAAGIKLGYDTWRSSSSSISGFTQKSTRVSVGPRLSCFHPCGEIENFGLQSTGQVLVGFGADENTDGSNTQKDDVLELGARFAAGAYWKATNRLLLGADFLNAGYTRTKKTAQGSDAEQTCNDWDFNVSPIPQFSMRVSF